MGWKIGTGGSGGLRRESDSEGNRADGVEAWARRGGVLWTDEWVACMDAEWPSGFAGESFSGFTAESFSGLSAELLSGLSAELFSGLSAESFSGFSVWMLSGFSVERFSVFFSSFFSELAARFSTGLALSFSTCLLPLPRSGLSAGFRSGLGDGSEALAASFRFAGSAVGLAASVFQRRLPSLLFFSVSSFPFGGAFGFAAVFGVAFPFGLALDFGLGLSFSSESLSSLDELTVEAPTGLENCERKARPPRRISPASCDRIRCESPLSVSTFNVAFVAPFGSVFDVLLDGALVVSLGAPFGIAFAAVLVVSLLRCGVSISLLASFAGSSFASFTDSFVSFLFVV